MPNVSNYTDKEIISRVSVRAVMRQSVGGRFGVCELENVPIVTLSKLLKLRAFFACNCEIVC
jgi:hypothetical protein